MKRFDRKMLRGYAATAVVLLAVLAWPSEGWSKTARHACDVNAFVKERLNNWAAKLAASSPTHPEPIVGTYAPEAAPPLAAVLLPTCANGPAIGPVAIEDYFVVHFLPNKPIVEGGFPNPTIGGDCDVAFASGLYTFKLQANNPPKTLYARYTFIFRHGLIAQHHSSLEPEPRPGAAACPSHH